MEERKSMGSALVDVFDAGVTLVKSEINGVARKAGDLAKAKGIGVVLLLASVGPLILALIFLILAVFYGLIRLGAGPWFAALLIALFSLAVTGALVFLGIKRLGAEVKTEEPLIRRPAMSDDSNDQTTPPATATAFASATGTPDDKTPQGRKVELRRDAQEHAAGETRVVAQRDGQATVRIEGGTTTVPVYESQPDGTPSQYGSGLNEKIAGKEHDSPAQAAPAVKRDVPGIPVSTDPTYQDDIRKGQGS
ncbi:phage holin family protein [Deinococcus sp.]|uniref:phage holin family protein n=1 Tax=Deinococcus sp. TaxID=47478 RepID=UPI002869BC44|nr:phage holin family protein [Deinococcus sp.]